MQWLNFREFFAPKYGQKIWYGTPSLGTRNGEPWQSWQLEFSKEWHHGATQECASGCLLLDAMGNSMGIKPAMRLIKMGIVV